MKKIIITLCLIIIFSVIFSYNSYENFISIEKRYKPQYVGPILFYDYNDNQIGSYPDDKIWPDFFKKVDNKYINLLGAGKPFEIKFPKPNKGNIGPKGYKGLFGDIGPKGPKGENITGPKGPEGEQGPRGDKGPTGGCNVCDKGDKGDKGNKGEVGDKGIKGPKGERPLKNEAETGIKGEVGDIGPTGTLRGLPGAQGPRGERGDKGLPGDVMARKGEPGRLEKVVRDDYLQINRPEINSPNEIEIGNPNTYIEIDTNKVFIKNNLCIKKNGIEKCINKDDISKLYKLNNPTCTCPHGEIVNRDKCTFNGIACRFCEPGYYKAKEIVNGEFQKNIETTICKPCNKQCGSNKYLDGCGGDNPGECKQCPGCPGGQHRVGCEGTIIGTCVPNTCSCSKGTKATGAACTSNGANICTSCNVGYYKNGNNCVACSSGYYKNGNNCVACSQCGAGQYETKSCHTNHNRQCAWKQCTCTDGTGAHGTSCPTNGQHKCISCKNNNYSLRNDRCTYNQILIYKDVGHSGELRWIGGANGTYHNLHDLKFNYTKGDKMGDKLSSFKKDPNARVTLYEHTGKRGKCIDLTGIGDRRWIGEWWNDKVSSVGYGIPCYNHQAFSSDAY